MLRDSDSKQDLSHDVVKPSDRFKESSNENGYAHQ
jgi:hypothetical protein